MTEPLPEYVIEAALLSSDRPVPVRELRRLFGDRLSAKTVKGHLEKLALFWEARALRLVETPEGWCFRTALDVSAHLRRLKKDRPRAYSRAALETLAVIAYRQPVTRGDIEAIRGVAVNPAILRQFEERGWIEAVGRRETPGRPELLGTTARFLSDLGLGSLSELPEAGPAELPDFALGEPAREKETTGQEPDAPRDEEGAAPE